MTAPLYKVLGWGPETGLVIAFVTGLAFGFFLERGGFGNSRKLALQFYLRDLTVFKTMFTAVITAMTGLVYLRAFGIIDFDLVYLNPTYVWSAVTGGLIMGTGFTVAGY
jgi:hypothetical protein